MRIQVQGTSLTADGTKLTIAEQANTAVELGVHFYTAAFFNSYCTFIKVKIKHKNKILRNTKTC